MARHTRTQHWKLHVTLALGLTLCVVAFFVEINRALQGHGLAWVYVIEWPVFAAFGTWVWWRLLTDEDDPTPAPAAPKTDESSADPQLRAWEDYVKRLEADEADRNQEN